ncbi:methylated-DNA--[protein]-cysteine S-methyltransferase [Opitutus sp. ER46]|uniref:methylated-DNA--[protein]-cysteine S-methyltransferase n=1 Tax=Opitutus sp. ER46 TaxID=2161864 RepID=UPI000D324F5A|nr:methylated-DNA--[protein]-cysteine S-methyltransferase [Opitutus sp. ER46]PTX92652.1 cysteine methyltransferase [Opitutus sp. ER46]
MPHATFSTPLGTCAIAWSDAGLTRFLLPDPDRGRSDTEATPPAWVATIIERVRNHLAGDMQDFCDVPFDFGRMPAFNRSVLEATLRVKPGHTASYGEIAAAIGEAPAASRAVGGALGSNPCPLLIPCHRIVAASGNMTGFSGPGGVATKARLLALEGAQLL